MSDPQPQPASKASKTQQTRALLSGAAAVLAVLFAVLNFGSVEVNWLFGTWSTPLIIVIAVSFVLGWLAGVFLSKRSKK